MTIVPRTGPLSAISARAITSWYQRGKSSARDTIAPLPMAAQVTGVPGGSPTSPRRDPPSVGRGGTPVDGLDLRRGVVRVLTSQVQQRLAVGLRLGLGSGVGGGDPGLGPLGHQSLRLLDEGLDHT